MRGTDLKKHIGHRVLATLDDSTGLAGTLEATTATTVSLRHAEIVDGPVRPQQVPGTVVIASTSIKTVHIRPEE